MIRIGAIAVVCVTCVADAQTSIPQVIVQAPPFAEHLDPSVQTAGGRILGLQLGDPRAGVPRGEIVVSGIRPTDRTLCISIEHLNGAYSAHFNHHPQTRTTTLRFVLPSRVIPDLSARSTELAILAQASSRETCGESDPILPAAWGSILPAGNAALLVNNHGASITRAQGGAGGFATCADLRDTVGERVALRAFQVGCSIGLPSGCAAEAPVTVKFVERRGQTAIRAVVRGRC